MKQRFSLFRQNAVSEIVDKHISGKQGLLYGRSSILMHGWQNIYNRLALSEAVMKAKEQLRIIWMTMEMDC